MPLSARFLTSASTLAECPPDDEPEVAFAGRSNAGKSSTLNRLTGSRRLARVSKTPGRTRLINFFTVEGGGRLVDLPGYGYAKAGKAERARWSQAIDDYLTHREMLAAVVLIMDARHPLQPFDVQMLDWAAQTETPLLALLNKSDKLKQGARIAVHRAVARQLADTGIGEVIPFSATSGLGAEIAEARVAAFLVGEAVAVGSGASATPDADT
ncbi:MAG: ribosome biogenesis GTP-binding protein YihA/YsxC [Gammaproteobacteria bacterium]|nr:ribosome biogenesis GTP-binding protein YihA/YsxC [Gammaproteobacteria bacterium]